MKKVFWILITTIILTAFMFFMSLHAFAAKTVSLLDGNVSITDELGNGSGSGTSYTATAKGGLLSKKTNTITIKNTGTAAKIEFDYSVSSATSFTVDGVDMTLASNKCSGSFSKSVEAGSEIPVAITSKSGVSGLTVTLNITNITYEELESSFVNVEFDSTLGAVTANGSAVSADTEITVEAAGTDLVATPVAGARFVAWLDESGMVKSWDATYKQLTDGTETIRALFSADTPYFMYTDEQSEESYIFDDWDAAVNSGKTKIVLACDGVLPAREEPYKVPSGVTLVIPFDAANTIFDADDNTKDVKAPGVEGYTNPSVYKKLTLASGANIEVYGTINVSANQSSSIGSTGMPTGKYGQIDMQSDSSITVKNGGILYAWGYITGSGSITAQSDATVYEDFQVADWRGGTATSGMADDVKDYTPYHVFPMSQYYVQNILVPLTLEAGAVENGYMSVYVTGLGIQGSVVPFIGENGMFNITSGSITKDYEESTDRLVIDVNGDLEMKSLNLTMKLGILSSAANINSAEYVLPINGNITLNINKGRKINISSSMALLPGGIINIEEGAECTFSKGTKGDTKVFIYDSDDWYYTDPETGKVVSYCSQYNYKFIPLKYVPDRVYTRTEADLNDAEIYIKGKGSIDATGGYIYTTAGGANIHADDGAKVKLNVDTTTTETSQAVQNNTSISYVKIPVTPAKLKNADGKTYVEPETLEQCWVYGCFDEQWMKKEDHKFEGSICSNCGCEKIATSTEYTMSGENIVIKTSLHLDVPEDTQIIITAYDSYGRLLSTALCTASALEEVTLPVADVKTIKIYAWESFATMAPFSTVEKIDL